MPDPTDLRGLPLWTRVPIERRGGAWRVQIERHKRPYCRVEVLGTGRKTIEKRAQALCAFLNFVLEKGHA